MSQVISESGILYDSKLGIFWFLNGVVYSWYETSHLDQKLENVWRTSHKKLSQLFKILLDNICLSFEHI